MLFFERIFQIVKNNLLQYSHLYKRDRGAFFQEVDPHRLIAE